MTNGVDYHNYVTMMEWMTHDPIEMPVKLVYVIDKYDADDDEEFPNSAALRIYEVNDDGGLTPFSIPTVLEDNGDDDHTIINIQSRTITKSFYDRICNDLHVDYAEVVVSRFLPYMAMVLPSAEELAENPLVIGDYYHDESNEGIPVEARGEYEMLMEDNPDSIHEHDGKWYMDADNTFELGTVYNGRI